MKKTSAFISAVALSLAVTLTLSGCAVQKDKSDAPSSTSSETELIDDISAAAAPSPSEALSESFDSIDSYAELCFGYTSDGKYEPVDYEEYISVIYAGYMASEEFYRTALEYDEYNDMSYEDFKKEMYSSFGIDPSAAEKYSKYSMFITVSYYSENENADHSAAARKGFDFFAEKLSEDSKFSADMLGEDKTIYVNIGQQGDIISVSAGYEDRDGEIVYIAQNESVSLYGEGYVLIGSTAVPADTESLYIFSEGRWFAEYFFDYEENSEEHQAAVFDYSSSSDSYTSNDKDLSIDLTDIAEKLPDLKKLLISHHIPITGFEGLEKYDGFSELNISEWHITAENADILAGLSNIKKLCIRDVQEKEDAEWTANAKFSELAFECEYPRDELLKFVYSMSNVTELTIKSAVPDLTGIEAMTGLKKLEIELHPDEEDIIDFAPIANLKALEELDFTGNNGNNFESIGNIKTLKSLTLSGIRSGWADETIDLSGLASCTSIEYLDISDIDSSIWSATPNMKKLKKIKFGMYGCPYDELDKVINPKSVEEIIFEDQSYLETNGISKLNKLKKLSFINCDFENISEISECPALKTLTVDCEDYTIFDAEDIENNKHIEEIYLKNVRFMHYKSLKTLKGLKKLTLISTDLTEEQTDDLRKDMTRCEIEAVLPEKDKNEYGEENAEADNSYNPVSLAEPFETVYIDNIRVETYYINDDYWSKTIYIKNDSKKPIENLTEFMEKNGFTDGCDSIIIYYPEYNGHSEVTEILEITDNGIDYENSEVYVDALSAFEEDYVENDLFRTLYPGCKAEVILHLKESDSGT